MNAIIYTKPHCQKCRRTVFKLSQVMPVQTVTADERDIERFRKCGYQSFPVVTVYKANGTHETWCDLRVDKIKQYTEMIQHVQFPITAHTNIRAGQAIRLDRMDLAASIRATNSDDCFTGVVYLIWDHHQITRGVMVMTNTSYTGDIYAK